MSTDPRDWTDRGTQRFLDTVDTSFYGIDYGTPAAALEACKRLMRDSSGVRESAALTERYHELFAVVEALPGESPEDTARWARIFAKAATQPASTPGNNVWD